MNDLLEAFIIFAGYTDAKFPTWCRHDELHVCVDPSTVSEADLLRLDELGFSYHDEGGEPEFISFRFGSCEEIL